VMVLLPSHGPIARYLLQGEAATESGGCHLSTIGIQ
jgi:hypothetical protein